MIGSDLKNYYRYHAFAYDITRSFFLFGRRELSKRIPKQTECYDILDVGCGTGYQLIAMSTFLPDSNLSGIDLSEDMLMIARKNLPDSVKLIHQKYDINSFPQSSFDVITTSYVPAMIHDIQAFTTAIYTHLKPGGIVLTLDFSYTRFDWFKKWMRMNHVDFDNNWVTHFENHFTSLETDHRNAFGGLYTYTTFAGRKD